MSRQITSEEINQFLSEMDTDALTIELVTKGAKHVNELKLWEWFETYEPPKGFMYNDHENVELMMNKTAYMGHSGASFGLMMRYLQKISRTVKKN